MLEDSIPLIVILSGSGTSCPSEAAALSGNPSVANSSKIGSCSRVRLKATIGFLNVLPRLGPDRSKKLLPAPVPIKYLGFLGLPSFTLLFSLYETPLAASYGTNPPFASAIPDHTVIGIKDAVVSFSLQPVS